MPLENNRPERITSITSQKKNRRRFNVFINDEYRFSVSGNIARTLETGEILTPSRIEAILSADHQEQAYEKSLHYLKFRPRSRREVTDYLGQKGFMDAAVAAVLERLEELGYVDDEAFARFWIESRERHRPRGEFALRYELRAKGISEAILDKMLAGYDEVEPAWRAILPKLRTWNAGDEFEWKKKIYAYLSRRGFAHRTCEAVVERAKETGPV